MYDPLGKCLIKSSGFAILLYKLVRFTLDFRAAEAIAGADMVLVTNLQLKRQSTKRSIIDYIGNQNTRKGMIYDSYVGTPP